MDLDLTHWLVAELDAVHQRIVEQVWEPTPRDAQSTALPGGNSIVWSTFHVARHAALALAVLGAPRPRSTALLADLPSEAGAAESGLHEVQRAWIAEFDPDAVRAYSEAVIGETRAFLGAVPLAVPAAPLPIAERLGELGIGADFAWLVGQWSAGGPEHLIRWPLLGHVTNHVGEMIATRNQLGHSPYR